MDILTYDKYDFFNIDNHFAKYQEVESVLMYGRKNDDTEISIVMPVYKRVEYIREAIESAINQNTKHVYSIIVVDNTEENEDIYEIVKSYPEDKVLYYKNKKNIGMFGNWNRCIEIANTPWVVMLHDDDKLKPDYIEYIMNIISDYPDFDAFSVEHEVINNYGKVIQNGYSNNRVNKLSLKDIYLGISSLCIAGFVFKKKVAISIGGFDENFYPGADANFMCKFQMINGHVGLVGKTLIQYRIAINESMNPNVLRGFVLYNYTQNKALLNYMSDWFKIFYRIHQNAIIFDGIKSSLFFNRNVDYEDIKKKLNYKKTLLVSVYRIVLKLIQPCLFKRIVGKVKKIGGVYK